MYEIIYDYTDEGGYESRNIVETFEGTYVEMQKYLRQMKRQGCYNISVTDISGDYF